MLKRILPAVLLGALVVAALSGVAWWPSLEVATAAGRNAANEARHKLVQGGFSPGLPVYVRIFKQDSELELWMHRDGRWHLFNTFAICAWSGTLGPKLKEGDRQSPEGFYQVEKASLNPGSRYHLSFNLGFPNAYDRSHGRTGSFLMVHGNCVSIGCYAMTDPVIEVIYGLVEEALKGGQSAVPVHIFPFRMNHRNMIRHGQSEWIEFWHELKFAFDAFEIDRKVPTVSVSPRRYVINAAG